MASGVALLPDNTVTIANRTWCPSLLYTLYVMSKSKQFCDVELAVKDVESTNDIDTIKDSTLNAHACILAASSNLLKDILDPNPRKRFVNMSALDKDVLSVCIDYMYGQPIRVTCDQVKALSQAADVLQIDALKKQCSDAQDIFDGVMSGSKKSGTASKTTHSDINNVKRAGDKSLSPSVMATDVNLKQICKITGVNKIKESEVTFDEKTNRNPKTAKNQNAVEVSKAAGDGKTKIPIVACVEKPKQVLILTKEGKLKPVSTELSSKFKQTPNVSVAGNASTISSTHDSNSQTSNASKEDSIFASPTSTSGNTSADGTVFFGGEEIKSSLSSDNTRVLATPTRRSDMYVVQSKTTSNIESEKDPFSSLNSDVIMSHNLDDDEQTVKINPTDDSLYFNASVKELIKQVMHSAKDEPKKIVKFILKQDDSPRTVGTNKQCTLSKTDDMQSERYDCKDTGMSTFIENIPTDAVQSDVDSEFININSANHNNTDKYDQMETRNELCDHCGKVFRSKKSLAAHKRMLTKTDSAKTRIKVLPKQKPEYLCADCDEIFVGIRNFKDHRKTVHVAKAQSENKIASDTNVKFDTKEAKHKKKMDKTPTMCDHCGNFFKGPLAVRAHMKRVAKNPNHITPSFDKSEQLARRQALKKAMAERQYFCTVCNETIVGSRNYYQHKLLLHDKKFVCRYCGNAFIYPNLLKAHEQRHNNEKNMQCAYCNYKAVSKTEVRNHIEIHHTGEQDLQCPYCPKVLKKALYLKIHINQYHKKGLKQCSYCEYQGIERHVKKHLLKKHFPDQVEKPFCQLCGKGLASQSGLRRHLLKVHEVTPHTSRRHGGNALYQQNKAKFNVKHIKLDFVKESSNFHSALQNPIMLQPDSHTLKPGSFDSQCEALSLHPKAETVEHSIQALQPESNVLQYSTVTMLPQTSFSHPPTSNESLETSCSSYSVELVTQSQAGGDVIEEYPDNVMLLRSSEGTLYHMDNTQPAEASEVQSATHALFN